MVHLVDQVWWRDSTTVTQFNGEFRGPMASKPRKATHEVHSTPKADTSHIEKQWKIKINKREKRRGITVNLYTAFLLAIFLMTLS